jgi:hypothetical protein
MTGLSSFVHADRLVAVRRERRENLNRGLGAAARPGPGRREAGLRRGERRAIGASHLQFHHGKSLPAGRSVAWEAPSPRTCAAPVLPRAAIPAAVMVRITIVSVKTQTARDTGTGHVADHAAGKKARRMLPAVAVAEVGGDDCEFSAGVLEMPMAPILMSTSSLFIELPVRRSSRLTALTLVGEPAQ